MVCSIGDGRVKNGETEERRNGRGIWHWRVGKRVGKSDVSELEVTMKVD